MNSTKLKQKCYIVIAIDIYKKNPICSDIQYTIRQTMPTSKTQKLASFSFFNKGMKVIIPENLYPKLGIVNRTIGYVENISLTKSHWIQHDEMMHPPINIFVYFNEIIFRKKHYKTSISKVYPNVILIAPIMRNFQYHHFIKESNTSIFKNVS
jgi:hypothetical protein